MKFIPKMVAYVDRYTRYPMDKANDLLGWRPQVNVQAGVQKSIPWLQEQGLLE